MKEEGFIKGSSNSSVKMLSYFVKKVQVSYSKNIGR